jgi:RND family efflux transporter MFP subunit
MRKVVIVLVLLIAAAGVLVFYNRSGQTAGPPPGERAGPWGGGGPGGGGAFGRSPMTVELATAGRVPLQEEITVVGNLIGATTVEVVPKVNGRLESVAVKLGDQVSRGQRIAKVEDQEIREQVKQAEAAYDVARATIRQREADLTFAETNLERSRNLYERQLLPRQTLDDAEARYQAANAQLDLARAQFSQSTARLEELRIALANTVIVSPVDGFVGRRNLDPGAFVSSNTPIAMVVDIRSVRMVANLVERDIRRVSAGVSATVEVDAFPGETFRGRVARVAPVLDPATRTATMEIEVPNPGFRLKPGMYARVRMTVGERTAVLVVPRNAVVDVDGRRGVFVPDEDTARFRPVSTGLQDDDQIEVTDGVAEGEPVITTGAAGLRDGDRIVLAGRTPGTERAAPADALGRPPMTRRPAG